MYMLTQSSFQEREQEVHQEEDRSHFLGVYTAMVEFYTEEVLQGFLPFDFPVENIYVTMLIFLSVCRSEGKHLPIYICLLT